MTNAIAKRPPSGAAKSHVGDLERKIIGAVLYGSESDWRGIKSCGFSSADICCPVMRGYWEIVHWAAKLGLPCAALPVLEVWEKDTATFLDPFCGDEKITRWDILELKRLNAKLNRKPVPVPPIPPRVADYQRLIESLLP